MDLGSAIIISGNEVFEVDEVEFLVDDECDCGCEEEEDEEEILIKNFKIRG